MKKILLVLLMMASATCFAQTQTRNCGTMDYYEMKKKSDPTFQKRMEADEQKVQEWIKSHPTNAASYPVINGFKATGNTALDNVNYAKAKEVYFKEHANVATPKPTISAKADEQARLQKRQQNTLITK